MKFLQFLNRFSTFDLVLIALMAALGIAIKPIVVPIAHIITGPLFIPGGVIAGGFYMLWIVLGAAIVGKLGTATLIAFIQAMMVLAGGIFGTHGAVSLMTYLAPGLAIDLLFLLTRHRGCCNMCCFFAGIVANITGSFLVNIVFFRLPLVPLMLSLSCAAISGGLGGIIAHTIYARFAHFKVFN